MVDAKSSGFRGKRNGVDTNEAAGMSSVISHPAGAIRPGTAPFSILCYQSPYYLYAPANPFTAPLHPLLISETRNPEVDRFFASNSPRS